MFINNTCPSILLTSMSNFHGSNVQLFMAASYKNPNIYVLLFPFLIRLPLHAQDGTGLDQARN